MPRHEHLILARSLSQHSRYCLETFTRLETDQHVAQDAQSVLRQTRLSQDRPGRRAVNFRNVRISLYFLHKANSKAVGKRCNPLDYISYRTTCATNSTLHHIIIPTPVTGAHITSQKAHWIHYRQARTNVRRITQDTTRRPN